MPLHLVRLVKSFFCVAVIFGWLFDYVSRSLWSIRGLRAFLTLQRGALLAASVPLPRDVASGPAVGGFARWTTLASLGESALYLPVAAAFVRVGGHSQRGMPVPHTAVADGAMSARRVAHRTMPPTLLPVAWSMQLQYLEAVDTHFRRGLLSAPKTHRHWARLAA